MIDVNGFWHDDENPNAVWAPAGGMDSPPEDRGYITSDALAAE